MGALAQDFASLKRGSQKRVLRQATMAGARVGRDAIRDAAPVREGITRKNVVAAAAKQNEPGTFTSGVRVRGERRDDGTSPAYTWRFSELGTSKEPARPWIRPPWDSNEDEIAAAVRNRLGSAIDEALGRR
nr:HK97-gp10 family putative phage morphogenesis protein [Luteimonas sp. XNQY3]